MNIPKSITDNETLLNEWESLTDDRIIRDGIIHTESWDYANLKILLVLKNGYNSDNSTTGWDLRESIRNKEIGITMREASYWMHCILNNLDSPLDITWEEAFNSLLSCAVINIVKTPESKKSDYQYILTQANRFDTLLKAQIEIINPDLIICGNTWRFLTPIVSGKISRTLGELVHQTEHGFIYMDFWHPSNRFPRLMNCMTLVNLLRKSGILPIK